MPSRLVDQRFAIDQQCGVVNAPRCQARQALSDRDRQQPAQGGRRERVQHEQAAGAQQAAGFRYRSAQVGDMFENFPGDYAVGTRVGQRYREDVAEHWLHSVLPALGQRRPGEVHANVPIPFARQMRCQEPCPATEIHQDRTGPDSGRYERSACGGQPMQHREDAALPPPLIGESLVQFGIVASHGACHCVQAGTLVDVRLIAVSALIRTSHPLPTLVVTSLAVGLASASGQDVTGVVTIGAAVLAGQLSVGWLNDLVDVDRDAAVGRIGKPLAAGEISRQALLVAILLSASAAVALSLPFGALATAVHATALISAWAYDLGLKAKPLSVLPYAVSFGLLPAFVLLGLPESQLPPPWLVLAAALLGAAAHFTNTLPDLADDVATGVWGLPHRLGPAKSVAVAAGSVLAASVLLVIGPAGSLSGIGWVTLPAAAIVLSIGFLLSRRPGSRAAFHSVMLVALIDVALLLSASAATS